MGLRFGPACLQHPLCLQKQQETKEEMLCYFFRIRIYTQVQATINISAAFTALLAHKQMCIDLFISISIFSIFSIFIQFRFFFELHRQCSLSWTACKFIDFQRKSNKLTTTTLASILRLCNNQFCLAIAAATALA